MIQELQIFNFQSHKKTIIEFIPGTSVIIGPTDAGKSAIFRALQWICSNRPLGDAFCSEWGGETKVVAHTSEGNIIERIRTKTRNEYIVNGTVLEAFGHSVPEEVTNILQIDSANIQAQMDSPFLLSATPGEAAKMLNKAASIDDIDYTIAGLKTSYRRIDSDIKYNEKQLSTNKEQMKQYENIAIIEEKLVQVELLEIEKLEKVRMLEALQQITEKIRNAEAQLKKTENVPVLFEKYTIVEKIYIAYQNGLMQYEKYAKVFNRAKDIVDMLDSTEYVEQGLSILKKTEAVYLTWKEKTKQTAVLKNISGKIKKYQTILESTDYLENAIILLSKTKEEFLDWQIRKKQIEKARQVMLAGQKISIDMKKTQEKIEQIEIEFQELAPEFCPLCGNKIMEGLI